MLYYVILYYIMLYYIILYYVVLHYIIPNIWCLLFFIYVYLTRYRQGKWIFGEEEANGKVS